MARNAYKTNDPEILLRLKRQEADALLDVLRSINQAHHKPEHIFKISRNALLAQCNVRKMKFVYRGDKGFHTGVKMGFGKLDRESLNELPEKLGVIPATEEKHPHLHALGVEYIVPVNYKNEVRAWFLIADFAESEAEKENDLIFIETIANVVSAAIENRNLIKDLVQQESLRRELEVAERIHHQLLTREFEIDSGADIYAENYAHHKIGGDYYDLIPRSEKGYFVCIADVAGKGIGAALLMANLQASLRALILSENSLKTLIHKLHKNIFSISQGEQFVTFFIAHVRTQDNMIDYINAGHNPPVILNSEGLKELKLGTIPIGIVDLPYVEEGSLPYEQGDLMFMYTDGLVEQHNVEDEMLGEERIHALLQEHAKSDSKTIVREMMTLYRDFCGEAVQDDDVTMLALRF